MAKGKDKKTRKPRRKEGEITILAKDFENKKAIAAAAQKLADKVWFQWADADETRKITAANLSASSKALNEAIRNA